MIDCLIDVLQSEGEEGEGPAAGLLDGEPMQVRLERVWNALLLPEGQRLDMAIKYSSHEYMDHLQEVQIMIMNSPGFPSLSSRIYVATWMCLCP